jgi:hypothetical protein
MAIKLQKNVEYKYKIPSYAPFRVGDIVRICNAKNIKKYQNSKEPYMNKLAVVIGYSTKSSSGPMTFAVRVIETGDEYLLYQYLLAKTEQRMHVPKFEIGDEVVLNSKKIEGKWVRIIKANQDATYDVIVLKDQKEYKVTERSLKFPTTEELAYKDLEQKLPELEGIFSF